MNDLDLLPLQACFQQHMLGEDDATPLLAGSAERRALGLRIYAHAYRARLVDALADAYAKTREVLGDEPAEEGFEGVALAYIAGHPPSTRSLRWYGADFALHLGQHLPERAELAELARLEWALRTAFDGPDAPLLSAADLAALPPHAWATLRLVPVPTAELLRFHHNTVAWWQALDDHTLAPPPACSEEAVHWLVWRKGLQPHFRSLHRVEAALLQAMLRGASFAQACEEAQSVSAEDCTPHIGAGLRQWLEDELLSSVG